MAALVGPASRACAYPLGSRQQRQQRSRCGPGSRSLSSTLSSTRSSGRSSSHAASRPCARSSSDDRDTTTTTSSSSSTPSTGSRRQALLLGAAAGALALVPQRSLAAESSLSKLEPMKALEGKDYGKPRMVYPDFVMTPSGLQYKDLREGSGPAPAPGDQLVVDWGGYTIGYYGRPFEARNKPKGGSFTGEDKDFLRFRLGEGQVIPAFEEAVAGMKLGGIRRIVVPVELGYPGNDFRKQGPKPSTFSGERALGFVLGNQGMIDKTLLFDIELLKILK